MESPFNDFLRTPSPRNDDFAQDFVNPLILDDDDPGAPFHDTPLFEDAGLFEPHSTSDRRMTSPLFSAINLDDMYPISPATPALDAPLFVPSPHRLPSKLPTSTRANLVPEALIPLDAPVRSRNYISQPPMPRRNVPRKRSRTEAFGSDDKSSQSTVEPDSVASGQSKNTAATHRSRRRKPDPLVELEASIERERRFKEEWKLRAIMFEAVLFSHGIPVPPATMHQSHSKVS